MSELDAAFALLGALLLGLALVSRKIRGTVVSDPAVALVYGVVIGPRGLGLLDPARWGDAPRLVEEAARITLAISLISIALRLPRGWPRHEWRTGVALLGLVMPAMWLVTATLAHLVLELPLAPALLLGAVLAPTDPVVATSVVTGDRAEAELPHHLRHAISFESGANDALAYPFVIAAVLLLGAPGHEVARELALGVVAWELGVALVVGVGLGLLAGKLLLLAEQRATIEQPSFLAYTLALTFCTLGVATLLRAAGLLAVFVAGLAFDQAASARERAAEERVQEAVNRLFTLPIFALLGSLLPWNAWAELGGRGVALAVAVLLLRRLPAMLLLRPALHSLRAAHDAAFAGWFGPLGVAALYYAELARRKTGADEVFTAATLVVAASILVHGATAAPLVTMYGRRARRVLRREEGREATSRRPSGGEEE